MAKKNTRPVDDPAGPNPCDDIRVGLKPETIAKALVDNLFYVQGRLPEFATRNDWYMALAITVRDRMIDRWVQTARTHLLQNAKTVCYLSAEFLMGPQLGNSLINLGIQDAVREAVEMVGLDLDELIDQEEEPGLGNGGLGRLAACYMDSLATIEVPAIGYGIRYEFGIFDQEIRDGGQVEVPDKWLRFGNPWEITRPEINFDVPFGGHTIQTQDEQGRFHVRWMPERVVLGIAHDIPVLGYRVNTSNVLRLWKAEACESFDLGSFNVGDYFGAVNDKVRSENISKVLYPNDVPLQGKRLRLEQQFFFVTCSLQDVIRQHLQAGNTLESLPDFYAIQLNDTHPSIAIAEMMRLLVDQNDMDWDTAWGVTRRTFGYTNHTLLPEALEKWPLPLFASLLPRHLEIIYEINRRFLDEVRVKFPGDAALLARLSLIDETGEKAVRMAHLASAGSHSINGVAALHTELLSRDVLHDFYLLYPERFHNVTNGVTPRRWIALSNPRLAQLITDAIGGGWVSRTEDELARLEPFAEDPAFRHQWRTIKRENKVDLSNMIRRETGISVNPDSMFDIQVKRIHEYKRQHLCLLEIITLYLRLKQDPGLDIAPRTFIFGGKAAPGYTMAKLIIRLVNGIADVVNRDPEIRDRLKVVFYPNFNVQSAQRIYPAADLSEQISTAGKEASGTGNMKFALNGALTIGTLDGANIEIRNHVGAENFFLFGLTAEEVRRLKQHGYQPMSYYYSDHMLHQVLDLIGWGEFSRGDSELFKPIVSSLMSRDEYFLLADYSSYVECQDRVNEAFLDKEGWARKSILNVARMGYFSSDRSVREYCEKIWKVTPVSVAIE
ncbi:MAG: glycogen/starch/alpha-glucan phosphorylase [Acidobacteria bacterium]|nr:glycogen/starch/alpha-glucan phosphorylase [Acidobacteriota bacterium]